MIVDDATFCNATDSRRYRLAYLTVGPLATKIYEGKSREQDSVTLPQMKVRKDCGGAGEFSTTYIGDNFP